MMVIGVTSKQACAIMSKLIAQTTPMQTKRRDYVLLLLTALKELLLIPSQRDARLPARMATTQMIILTLVWTCVQILLISLDYGEFVDLRVSLL